MMDENVEWQPDFVWRYGFVGWMRKPMPRGHYTFYQWCWDLRTYRWMTFGRLAIQVAIKA